MSLVRSRRWRPRREIDPLKTKQIPCKVTSKRRRADSNRCTRLCRPLPNHSATAPYGRPWYRRPSRRGLSAGQFRAGREWAARLERLEAEVAARRDDCGREIDEARARVNRKRLVGNVEQEPIERRVEGGVPVLGVPLHGRRGGAEPPQVGVQLLPLAFLLGRHLRPLTLTRLLDPAKVRAAGRSAATRDRGAERDGEEPPRPHASKLAARYAATPLNWGMISSPYASSVSSWPCVMR